jgi:hypothetical protein
LCIFPPPFLLLPEEDSEAVPEPEAGLVPEAPDVPGIVRS